MQPHCKGTVDVAYEEQLVADEQQVKTGSVGIEQQAETQTTYILVPVDKQRVVVSTLFVTAHHNRV